MSSYASPAMRACRQVYHRLPQTVLGSLPQAAMTAGAAPGSGKMVSANHLAV